MRFFFRSRQFRIILLITVLLIAVSALCMFIGGKISPQADIVGTITAPFKYVATEISNGISDMVSAYKNGNEIMIKNAELESQISELRGEIADYEQISTDNEFYKEYLGIKDEHPDYKFAPATKISRDAEDPYKSFVINKGSYNGISANDPVITSAGVVGYVSKVGFTTATVSTILSPDVMLGAIDNRTFDSGVVSGNLQFAKDGKAKLFNLSRSCTVAIGDYVITSGEGIFPSGLLIGTIQSIGSDEYNTSVYASVEPFADIDNIRKVMVITDFDGKGGLTVSSENSESEE